MAFNKFADNESPKIIVTKEAIEAQNKSAIDTLNKQIGLIKDDISVLEEKKKELILSIVEIKKEKKAEANAFSEELLTRELAVNARETAVLSNETVLETRKNEFQATKNEQLLSLAKREDQLLLRDKDLTQLRARLEQREAEIIKNEKALELRSANITKANQDLDSRNSQMAKDIAELQSSQAEYGRKALDLESLISATKEREQSCRTKENELAKERHELDTKIGKLDMGWEELNKKAEVVENQLKMASAEAEAAKLLKKQAEGQAIENQQRSDTLDERETSLNTLQKQLIGEKENG